MGKRCEIRMWACQQSTPTGVILLWLSEVFSITLILWGGHSCHAILSLRSLPPHIYSHFDTQGCLRGLQVCWLCSSFCVTAASAQVRNLGSVR